MATLQQMRQDTYLAIANYKDLPLEEILASLKKRYPKPTINRWLNAGLDFVVRETRCLYKEQKGTVTIGMYWIKLPSACIDVLEVWFKETGEDEVQLTPRTQRQLNEEHDDWESSTNDSDTDCPEEYMMLKEQAGTGSGHSIKIRPRPDIEGVIRVCFNCKAPVMTDSVDCSLDDYWYQAVIDYALYKAVGNTKDIQELGVFIQSIIKEKDSKNTDIKRWSPTEKTWRN